MRIETLPTHVTYYKGRKSRVVTNVIKYTLISSLNILWAYRDFAPFRFFFTLGLIPFIFGVLCLIFLGYHWLSTGSFSPYKFVGFTGLYLVTLGFSLLGSSGMLADMMVRIQGTQEKMYEDIKQIRHPNE